MSSDNTYLDKKGLQYFLEKLLFNVTSGSNTKGLEIIEGTETIEAGESIYLEKDISFSKYDLRTLRVRNNINGPMVFKIGDNSDINDARYISLKEYFIDDIIQYPFYDKNNTGKIYIWIENSSNSVINVNYEIRITSL